MSAFPQQQTSTMATGRSVLCQKQSSRLLDSDRAIVARLGDDELGKFAWLSLDVDTAAMLLDNNVMGHREAESCSFPGWFGGEKGIEHLLSHLGWDTGAVVANSDFDCLAKVFGCSAEDRLKGPITNFEFAPGCCIEA